MIEMEKKLSPLLITTAINPPPDVYALEMTLAEKRLALSKAAIFFWGGFGIKKIVIADATDKVILNAGDLELLLAMDIEIEQIRYRQNDLSVTEKGKGYGEGSLINFALQTSTILKKEEFFYKCTGKVFCRNFNEIQKMVESNKIQNIFWREPLNGTVDTRFFYISKSFCEQFLIPAYEKIDDRKGIWSEHVVFELVRSKLTNLNAIRPLLSGFSGSVDQPYFDKTLGYLDYHFPCWVGS